MISYAYLAGTVDDEAYKAKCVALKEEAARVGELLAQVGNVGANAGETALALFDWAQRAGDLWRGSNNGIRREVLDLICLNRTLSDTSLVTEKRKPFDVFAKRLDLKDSRGDSIFTQPKIEITHQDIRAA